MFLHISFFSVLQSLKIACIQSNSEDLDEMLHSVAFNLVLHCLPKYPFRGLHYTKGYLHKYSFSLDQLPIANHALRTILINYVN